MRMIDGSSTSYTAKSSSTLACKGAASVRQLETPKRAHCRAPEIHPASPLLPRHCHRRQQLVHLCGWQAALRRQVGQPAAQFFQQLDVGLALHSRTGAEGSGWAQDRSSGWAQDGMQGSHGSGGAGRTSASCWASTVCLHSASTASTQPMLSFLTSSIMLSARGPLSENIAGRSDACTPESQAEKHSLMHTAPTDAHAWLCMHSSAEALATSHQPPVTRRRTATSAVVASTATFHSTIARRAAAPSRCHSKSSKIRCVLAAAACQRIACSSLQARVPSLTPEPARRPAAEKSLNTWISVPHLPAGPQARLWRGLVAALACPSLRHSIGAR